MFTISLASLHHLRLRSAVCARLKAGEISLPIRAGRRPPSSALSAAVPRPVSRAGIRPGRPAEVTLLLLGYRLIRHFLRCSRVARDGQSTHCATRVVHVPGRATRTRRAGHSRGFSTTSVFTAGHAVLAPSAGAHFPAGNTQHALGAEAGRHVLSALWATRLSLTPRWSGPPSSRGCS